MTDRTAALAALAARLAASFAGLADKPEETPEGTARALWLAAAGVPVSVEAAASAALPELGAEGTAALEALAARRLGGEPLAHITGRQRFMGLDFLAGPEADRRGRHRRDPGHGRGRALQRGRVADADGPRQKGCVRTGGTAEAGDRLTRI